MKSACLIVQMIYDIDVRVRRKGEALVAAGYSVDVLALRAPGGKKSYTLNGVNVRTISLGKQRGSLARYLFEYTAFLVWAAVALSVRMLRRRYAVIDVNTLPDFLIFAAALAKLQGAKLVLDMHEITPEFYISKYGIAPNSWLVRLLKFVERISFQFADHVLTVDKPIEDLLVSRGLVRSKSTIIMNAADESRFAGMAGEPAGDAGDEEGKKFVMMYHGTLTPIYGLDIAIEAFALVCEEMPQAEFWILGAGTEEDALASLIKQRGLTSRVKLLGKVPGSEIPGWLRQCTVGVLPIRRDIFLDYAFPNKLPELIIMGKPVIISRLNAIRHYFQEDSLAYFEPNNSSDLSRQMLRLYQEPRLRSELVRKAQQEYAPMCWDVMKKRYLAIMNTLSGITAENAASPAPLHSVLGQIARPD